METAVGTENECWKKTYKYINTVNMILDGSTATLTVAADYPLASLLVCGDIPNAYASDLD